MRKRNQKSAWGLLLGGAVLLGNLSGGPVPSSANDLIWQTLIDSADRAAKNGDYDESAKQLSAALKNINIGAKEIDPRLPSTRRKLADVFAHKGMYAEATSEWKKVVEFDQKLDAKNTENLEQTASDINELAIAYRRLNLCSESEAQFNAAIAIAEKLHKSDASTSSQSLASILCNKAMLYQDMGKYSEEEALLKKALSLQEDESAQANTLEQIGKLYVLKNRFDEAKPLLEKSLALQEKVLGLGNVALAAPLTDLGKLYAEQGSTDAAQKYLKRALVLRERELGTNHPDVADSLIALADFNHEQGSNSDAMPLYDRAATILEEIGGNNPSARVATAINKLADAKMDANNYDRAEELYKKALSIDQKVFGSTSRDVGRDISNVARLNLCQGRYSDAEPLYRKALEIVQTKAGKSHPDVASCLNNLAWLLSNEGKLAEAETLAKEGLAIREAAFGKDHPAVARSLANLADIYMLEGKWSDAESSLKLALEIETATLDPSHQDIATNMRELAIVEDHLKQMQAVEKLYTDLLKLDTAKYGADKAIIAADLDGLAQALKAQGKDKDAEPLLRKSEYIKEQLPGAVLDTGTSGQDPPKQDDGPTPDCPIDDKWALVVGISNFKNPEMNLKYAAKDAIDFRNYLVNEAHFKADHVKLLVDRDATRDKIVGNLGDQWLQRLANPNDLVVIYVSSHGTSVAPETSKSGTGSNFLLPHDGSLENVLLNGITMQWLTAGVRDIVHCGRIVLILDVCHSGALAEGAKDLSRKNTFDTRKLTVGKGQIVVASSQADQISWESVNYPNSVFTRRLLDGLRSHGEKTKLGEAFQFMKEKVQEEVLRDRAVLQSPLMVTQWWRGDDVIIATPPVKPRPGLGQNMERGISPFQSKSKTIQKHAPVKKH